VSRLFADIQESPRLRLYRLPLMEVMGAPIVLDSAAPSLLVS